jgi:hypothetical protein
MPRAGSQGLIMLYGSDGLNVKDDIVLNAELAGLNAIVKQMTGENFTIEDHGTYYNLILTSGQRQKVTSFIKGAIAPGGDPGKIRLDIVPLVFPAVLATYGKLIASAIIIIFLLGRLSK